MVGMNRFTQEREAAWREAEAREQDAELTVDQRRLKDLLVAGVVVRTERGLEKGPNWNEIVFDPGKLS